MVVCASSQRIVKYIVQHHSSRAATNAVFSKHSSATERVTRQKASATLSSIQQPPQDLSALHLSRQAYLGFREPDTHAQRQGNGDSQKALLFSAVLRTSSLSCGVYMASISGASTCTGTRVEIASMSASVKSEGCPMVRQSSNGCEFWSLLVGLSVSEAR